MKYVCGIDCLIGSGLVVCPVTVGQCNLKGYKVILESLLLADLFLQSIKTILYEFHLLDDCGNLFVVQVAVFFVF